MKLTVENSLTTVDTTPEQLRALDKRFTIWKKNDFYRKRMCPYANIKPVQLLQGNKLPTGLVPLICKEFTDVQVIDLRKVPTGAPMNVRPPHQLKHFQKAAVDYLLARGRGIVWSPTGTGKTYISGEIIRRLNLPTLYIIESKSALGQIQEKLSWLDCTIGICGDGKMEEGQVVISTIQSVRKLPLHIFNIIIASEAHHLPANTYYTLLEEAHNAYYRFGETGSLMGRSDGLEILVEAALSTDVYKIDVNDPEVKEMRPSIKVCMLQLRFSSDGLDYSYAYDRNIIANQERNQLIAELSARYADKTQLIYVKRLPHGRKLQELIPDSKFVYSKTPLQERQEILASMKGQTVIATDVFSESLDIPELDIIIHAASGKSPITVQQVVGRAMRGDATRTVMVFDIFDKDGAMFERQATARRRTYKKLTDVVSTYSPEGARGGSN